MKTVYSADHKLRSARTELAAGLLVPPHECPQRAEYVLERVRERQLGDILAPRDFPDGAITRIHDAEFVAFLKSAWKEWAAQGNQGEAIPDCWPARRMAVRRPEAIAGKLGYYAMAAETSISNGTWEAARAAANVALTGAALLHQG